MSVLLRVVPDASELHVEGSVVGPDGLTRPFAGWMALLDALEGVVDGQRADAGRV